MGNGDEQWSLVTCSLEENVRAGRRTLLRNCDEGETESIMQLNLPPDLEALINKRLSTGAYTNAEDVLRHALEAQDEEESLTDEEWTDEERRAISAQIEEGYQQAERGELIDGVQARHEIQAMKEKWREGRSPGR
jgi:Arc/MetJ-type ribon-helix-helix transcriptional regulator